MGERSSYRKWIVTGALATGAALGAYGIAGAATSSSSSSTTTNKPPAPSFHSNEDPAHEKAESPEREAQENSGRFSGHGNFHAGEQSEKVVTGAAAAKIKAAALKAVPGTVTKTEQRADGTYEAEITKADGTEVHVSLDKNFNVIDTGHGPQGARDGWHHGFGPRGGGPEGGAPSNGPSA
jgi:hypothetical protein